MTVIAAGVVNRQGKIIMSRQFTDISRIRIEGLLSAFPKLLGTGGNKQCTFIDAGAVRYVYQPIEALLLVLVTSKSSNIVEDLATLRLMGRLIPEYVQTIDEENVAAKAFEVLFAFDEVIVGGHRENNTIEQILTYLEMNSHEEEVAKEEKKLQMELAKKEARRRAMEITQKRRENGGGYGGIGSHGSGRGGSTGSNDDDDYRPSAAENNASQVPQSRFETVVEDAPKAQAKPKTVGGMSLGKARKADVSSKVLLETGAAPLAAAVTAPAVVASAVGSSSQEGIHIRLEEKISANLNRDGGATNVDVRGDMLITVSDAQLANVRLLLGRINDDFNFRTHPNINKNIFTSDRVLMIKDNKPFPTHQTLGILKWRLQNPGRVRAPLSVTCWPGDSSATVEFELENLQATLHHVVITIPLGGVPVQEVEPSAGTFEVQQGVVSWSIPLVDSGNSSGSLNLTLAGDATEASFFPMNVNFVANASIAGVQVNEVVGVDTGMPVRYSCETVLAAEEYVVV